MDLNIARQPGQKTAPPALVRAVKRADAILARMIADETYLDGATAYTSPQRPAVALANWASDLRLPPGVAAATVIDTVEGHFASLGVACGALEATEADWPAALSDELVRRGYRPVVCGVHVLGGYAPGGAALDVQVIPGRAAYGEVRTLLEQRALGAAARGAGRDDAGTDDDGKVDARDAAGQIAAAAIDQLDDPRVDVFIARRQRRPVGLASLLTLGNIGVIIDLFADEADAPALATLADRLFDHCLRAQFEQVIVSLEEGDARASLFASLGFSPVTRYERYVAPGQ